MPYKLRINNKNNNKKESNKMVSNSNTETELSDVVLTGVLTLLQNSQSRKWVGTMTELDRSLTRVLKNHVPENWPGSPSALRVELNKVVNRIRVRKVSVKFGRTSGDNSTRYVKFVAR